MIHNRDTFQGMCLVDEDGSNTIEYYDELPPDVRTLFQTAKVNLCPCCLGGRVRNQRVTQEIVIRKGFLGFGRKTQTFETVSFVEPTLDTWVQVINKAEDEILNS